MDRQSNAQVLTAMFNHDVPGWSEVDRAKFLVEQGATVDRALVTMTLWMLGTRPGDTGQADELRLVLGSAMYAGYLIGQREREGQEARL